jgi:hypothetical protein
VPFILCFPFFSSLPSTQSNSINQSMINQQIHIITSSILTPAIHPLSLFSRNHRHRDRRCSAAPSSSLHCCPVRSQAAGFCFPSAAFPRRRAKITCRARASPVQSPSTSASLPQPQTPPVSAVAAITRAGHSLHRSAPCSISSSAAICPRSRRRPVTTCVLPVPPP